MIVQKEKFQSLAHAAVAVDDWSSEVKKDGREPAALFAIVDCFDEATPVATLATRLHARRLLTSFNEDSAARMVAAMDATPKETGTLQVLVIGPNEARISTSVVLAEWARATMKSEEELH